MATVLYTFLLQEMPAKLSIMPGEEKNIADNREYNIHSHLHLMYGHYTQDRTENNVSYVV